MATLRLQALLTALVLAGCTGTAGPLTEVTEEQDGGNRGEAGGGGGELDGESGGELAGEGELIPEPCDDGNPCTAFDHLADDGSCLPGQPYECDDGRPCTQDSCDGKGDCLFQLQPGWCLVEGLCYADGEPSPEGCRSCQVELDTFELQAVASGDPCDDGDPCTVDEVCNEGLCKGTQATCDDDNPCTADGCSPLEGCHHEPLTGPACGEGDGCKSAAICVNGECLAGSGLDCDDDNPCTADSCLDGECLHEPLDGLPCDDGDLCATGDQCVGDLCLPGAELLDCNDYNECTGDLCHPVSGCYHELALNPCCNDQGINVCDDGNICTIDSCDPENGKCFYAFSQFKCTDQNPCTGPDLCQEGLCLGAPLSCDDGNPCTQDWCEAPLGCQHLALDAVACDDGLECSTGDLCVAGKCQADLSGCACQPQFSPHVNKINSLAIGADGKTGNGLDVDLYPTTCAPPNNCTGGIDNSLSLLAGFANSALADALTKGDVILLLEHRQFQADGKPYSLAVYIGEPAADGCDIQSATCDYLVLGDSFDSDCNPVVRLDNAQVKGTQLSAGGPGYNFSFPLPLAEGVVLEVILYHARIEAKITFAGGGPAALSGVMAGAIAKQDIIEAIELVPEERLPMSKSMILSLINAMVTNDIDTDGDGLLDAASIGLPFGAIKAQVVGTKL